VRRIAVSPRRPATAGAVHSSRARGRRTRRCDRARLGACDAHARAVSWWCIGDLAVPDAMAGAGAAAPGQLVSL